MSGWQAYESARASVAAENPDWPSWRVAIAAMGESGFDTSGNPIPDSGRQQCATMARDGIKPLMADVGGA